MVKPFAMSWLYRLGQLSGRFIFFCTMRLEIIRPEAARRARPFILASTHLGNLDPFLLGVILDRQIDWITRVEFYRHAILARMLDHLDAIKVRRFGVPVSTIRTAIARLQKGRIVGICPEGGVCRGENSCLRGAPLKRGFALIAYRTGAPVLPCVIIGADRLNRVAPWLPFRRARLWVAFGDGVITPRTDLDRKHARELMAQQLQHAYARLGGELRAAYGRIDDAID